MAGNPKPRMRQHRRWEGGTMAGKPEPRMRPNWERGTLVGMAGVLWLFLAAAAQRPAPNACLLSMHGRWAGPGTVANRPIRMVQAWGPALQGAFTELRMTHHAPGDTTRALFEGRGLYTAAGSDSVTGTWFDARGISMPLRGRCTGATLTMDWLGDQERGRTSYTMQGRDSLTVLDDVVMPDGSARAFGRSMLKRTP